MIRTLLGRTLCTTLILCALLILSAVLHRGAQASGKGGSAEDSSTLSEVIVNAKPLDKRALTHAAKKFAESHETLNPRSGQISHWVAPVCPVTRGLRAPYDEYLSRRILTIAHEVGAPSGTGRNCRANAWILFTRDPQAQLDHIARIAPSMLGYTSGSLKQLATVRFPIQAWYVTGTAAAEDPTPRLDSVNSKFLPFINDEGRYPSRLEDVVSQIGFVLVVVDTAKIGRYSLDTISDYLAMVILTTTALNGCNLLPSIIDLLSPDCGSRERPAALTDADRAFLKALYGARFGMKVGFEQDQISHDMLHALGR